MVDPSFFLALPLALIWYAVGYRHGVRAEKIRACQAALDKFQALTREGKL